LKSCNEKNVNNHYDSDPIASNSVLNGAMGGYNRKCKLAKEKNIQLSKRNKFVDRVKALEKQNTIRKNYGLRLLKRLDLETFLYFLNDDEQQKKPLCINPNYDGGMYQ
jgi:hypothetical protein